MLANCGFKQHQRLPVWALPAPSGRDTCLGGVQHSTAHLGRFGEVLVAGCTCAMSQAPQEQTMGVQTVKGVLVQRLAYHLPGAYLGRLLQVRCMPWSGCGYVMPFLFQGIAGWCQPLCGCAAPQGQHTLADDARPHWCRRCEALQHTRVTQRACAGSAGIRSYAGGVAGCWGMGVECLQVLSGQRDLGGRGGDAGPL